MFKRFKNVCKNVSELRRTFKNDSLLKLSQYHLYASVMTKDEVQIVCLNY